MSEAVRLAHRPIAIADSDEPLILIDARGRVHDLSPTAAQLLSEADGLFMEGGYLRASHRGEQPRIDDTLKSALTAMERGGAGGNLALSRPSGRRPLLIRISPLPAPSSPLEALSPTALVSVVDPETSAFGKRCGPLDDIVRPDEGRSPAGGGVADRRRKFAGYRRHPRHRLRHGTRPTCQPVRQDRHPQPTPAFAPAEPHRIVADPSRPNELLLGLSRRRGLYDPAPAFEHSADVAGTGGGAARVDRGVAEIAAEGGAEMGPGC